MRLYVSRYTHEIVVQYNAQIRDFYNYYHLASNVSMLNKSRYVMEYSMYKTFAGKYRITMTKAKLRYHKNGVFSVPYRNKSGKKSVVFYNGGFPRVKYAMGNFVDQTPKYSKLTCPESFTSASKGGYATYEAQSARM